MQKRLLATIFWLVGLLCATACGTSRPGIAASGDPLLPQKEQVWQLVALRGKPVGKEMVTITFNTEAGIVSGTAPCNRYGADCRFSSRTESPEGDRYSIAIANVTHTDILCPDADMNAEARYLALLSKADAVLVGAYTITMYQHDKETLRFELQ